MFFDACPFRSKLYVLNFVIARARNLQYCGAENAISSYRTGFERTLAVKCLEEDNPRKG